MMTDDSFGKKAKYYGDLFKDQETNPVDRAVYHTEFLMRTKGAEHLKYAHGHLNWFQYHSLDVVAFLLAATVGTVALIFLTVRFVVRCLCCRGKRSNGKKLKKK